MTAKEATVEVLTAEVRVLMVGSRQVTLSVYKQLDVATLGRNFEIFGRVRARRFGGVTGFAQDVIEVVGARDGTLCASWLCRSDGRTVTGYNDPGGRLNHDAGEQVWDQLEEYPLIVLAGLR